MVRITSTSFINRHGVEKVQADETIGARGHNAISVIESEDVLLAKIVFLGQILSSAAVELALVGQLLDYRFDDDVGVL